jgi:hypothetical protein
VYETTARTYEPVDPKKYESWKSPSKADLKTTAATRKYGADFEEDFRPVNSFA